jgi:dTDP-4-amino-4,6-dideoxygalactose transaminase
MKVPLLDLKPQISELREEIIQAVTQVIDSTQFILGPEVSKLEDAVAEYSNVSHAVGVSSGTDALLISLMAMGIGPGDRVLTTPYSFFATMGSIVRTGALPIFVDIQPGSMNIDPDQVSACLKEDAKSKRSIKAIIPVHLYGQCADMQSIMELASEYGIPVIEDAAQAIGAECPYEIDGQTEWKKAGSMGTAGCFSFFPSKNLGGIGDGGMVTTNDSDLAEQLRIFRNHGARPKYFHSYVGGNFRLDPVQACVLNIKLKHLDKWHVQRRQNSELYKQYFLEAGLVGEFVTLPVEQYNNVAGSEKHNHHIYNQFVIRVQKRDQLREFLTYNEIGCEVYYPLCLHQQKCLEKYDLSVGSYPESERAAMESLALPIYPELQSDQLEYVVETISRFFRS